MAKIAARKTEGDLTNFSAEEIAEIFTASLQWLREKMGKDFKFANKPGELVLYLPGLELVALPNGKAAVRLIGGGQQGEGNQPEAVLETAGKC